MDVPINTGTLFNTQRFCIHDGPGIRTTVFFKGCPMRCPWCHNPEGIAPEPEVTLDRGRCIGCGGCQARCPRQSADLLAQDCTGCGACEDACPTGARLRVGGAWTVSQVRELLVRDRVFYESSGGGVTFSGGEPLMQPEFLLSCLRACQAEGLHTAIDTCGCGSRQALLAAAHLADLVLFDLKVLDPGRHLRLLGVPLEPIVRNLRALHASGARLLVRVPVVPGLTDTDENVAAVRDLLGELPGVQGVCLLPYHRNGVSKRERTRRAGRSAGRAGNDSEPTHDPAPPSRERLEQIAATLANAARTVTVGASP